MVTRYGFISDIHHNPQRANQAIRTLVDEGIDRLVLNGDIGENFYLREKDGSFQLKSGQPILDRQTSQDFTAQILRAAGESGIETYILPGSHESVQVFQGTVTHFTEKYGNLHNTLVERYVEEDDHHLAFLPGSDTLANGAEYQIGGGQLPTGTYILATFPEGIGPIPYENGLAPVLKKANRFVGYLEFTNIADLGNLVIEPEKTIAICHVPALFDVAHGVDRAYFGKNAKGHIRPAIAVEAEVRERFRKIPPRNEADVRICAAQIGWPLQWQNVGNPLLKKAYEQLGITKAVSGHIHEAGHNAHDCSGERVPEGELVNSLFWNSGCLDQGQLGILTVDGTQVSYQNLRLSFLV